LFLIYLKKQWFGSKSFFYYNLYEHIIFLIEAYLEI